MALRSYSAKYRWWNHQHLKFRTQYHEVPSFFQGPSLTNGHENAACSIVWDSNILAQAVQIKCGNCTPVWRFWWSLTSSTSRKDLLQISGAAPSNLRTSMFLNHLRKSKITLGHCPHPWLILEISKIHGQKQEFQDNWCVSHLPSLDCTLR